MRGIHTKLLDTESCCGKVLIVGDSIALGALEVIDRTVTMRVQRSFVEDLRDAFPGVQFPIDAAATRTSDNLRMLIDSLLRTHQPDVVLLVIGGGDADVNWRRFIISGGTIAQSAVPRERYERNMRQVIEKIFASYAHPVLTDITNHWLDTRGPYLSKLSGRDLNEMIRREGGQARSDAGLEEYRKVVRRLAAETGAGFVDFTEALACHAPQDRVGFDGMHPSQLAHGAIGAATMLVLGRVLRVHARPAAVVASAMGGIKR